METTSQVLVAFNAYNYVILPSKKEDGESWLEAPADRHPARYT